MGFSDQLLQAVSIAPKRNGESIISNSFVDHRYEVSFLQFIPHSKVTGLDHWLTLGTTVLLNNDNIMMLQIISSVRPQ